ncbi:MAG: enoyl-CoA hydratase-related protein [Gammaproteobacteria bacterium]|nr:enoyl-CoA hydratase-related protein [Gammaproteobacteria bacterium]
MLEAENFETILIDKRANGVVLATLNRPERLNAVNGRMHTELANIVREADNDDDVKVLVLTGAGRAFCAGGDFSGDNDVLGGGRQGLKETKEIVDHLLDCSIPVISAVKGYAMGLGATVALLADIVVAGHSTTFADTHVKMGVGAGDGGQVIWPLLMGVNRAKYYLMTGDGITGEDAERAGLVNFLVDDEDVLDKALEVADRLAAGPSLAISASKVAINQYIKMISNLVLPYSFAMEIQTFRSADAKEAAVAFQEKREPQFRGS